MTTLSADLTTQSVSADSLLKTIGVKLKNSAASIGNCFINVSEVIYEARKEEVRLRAHYRI